MELKTWNNLKVGDRVTVRSVSEMLRIKGVAIDEDGDLEIVDFETDHTWFVTATDGDYGMSEFCGKTLTITEISGSFVFLDIDSRYLFSRKMLRDEVIKNED